MQTIEPPVPTPLNNIPVAPAPPQPVQQTPPEPSPLPVVQKKSGFPILPIIVIVIGIIAVTCLLVYLFYIKPRTVLVQDSRRLSSAIAPLKAQLKAVDKSLQDMFNLITHPSQSTGNGNTLLRLNVDSFISQIQSITPSAGQVAGASTTSNATNSQVHLFATMIQASAGKLKQSSGFGQLKQNVLGTTTALESERVTLLRQLKEYAITGSSSVTGANTELGKLQQNTGSLINTHLHTELYPVLQQLSTNNLKAQNYLLQADRTTSYYKRISEIQIRLNPMLVSYITLISSVAQSPSPSLYLDRIKEIEKSIDQIDKDVRAIKQSDIPEGMGDLHNDNIQVADILQENVQAVRKAMEDEDYLTFVKSVVLVSQQLEPIATRAVSTELSFWQDNGYLRDGTKIMADYDKETKNLTNIIDKNKVPYLPAS